MHFDYNIFIYIIIVSKFSKIHSKPSSDLKRVILKNNYTELYSIAATTITILKKCYSDDLDGTIFAGDWNDFLSWKDFFSEISINIIGSKESKVFKRHKRLNGIYEISEIIVKSLRYPAEIAIVSTMHEPLKDTFKMLRSSKFWNSEATFFLIDENPKNLCLNSAYSLQIAWKYNILHAVYICYSADSTIYFYNFNPFMDDAPEPWKKVKILMDNERNHPITVYRISASDILTLKNSYCKLLNFDKTSILDNYPIKLCGVLNPILLNDSNNLSNKIQNINDFSGIDSVVARLIWNKLQTTPTVKSFMDSGYIENNVPHGLVKKIINEDYDMIINEFYYRSFWRLETYPHGISGMCSLTRKRFRTSNIATMLWMFEPKVISIVIPVSLLVAVMLKYLLKIGFVNTCLKVLGMLAGASINHPISGINRINVAYLIFLMFGLNLFLESSLTSFLVAPNNIYNIDSMEDIVNYKYEVSGRPFVKEFLVEDNFTEVYSENYFDECMDKIRMGHRVACIRDCLSAIFYERKHDFIYLSKQSVKDIYMTFLFREDWPLRVRFNTIVQRIREAGIIAFVRNIEVFKAYPHRPTYKKQDGLNRIDSQKEASLNLNAMLFAWYILGAGTALSFIIFIFELYIIKENFKI